MNFLPRECHTLRSVTLARLVSQTVGLIAFACIVCITLDCLSVLMLLMTYGHEYDLITNPAVHLKFKTVHRALRTAMAAGV